jgi:hypothetical protein
MEELPSGQHLYQQLQILYAFPVNKMQTSHL